MRTNFGFGWAASARAVSISVAIVVIVLAAWSPAAAHDNGNTAHLWNHIKAMGDAGTINDSANPVHWTKLKGVPASIADGLDNIGSAGFGLNLVRGGTFYVNTSQIQRRVATACVKGQAIKKINADGSIVCTTGPQGYTKRTADTGQICDSGCTEGTLTLSPGTWAIFGKITVHQTDGSEDHLFSSCELHAGGLIDRSYGEAQIDNITETMTMNMQLMVTLTNQVNASINCSDGGAGNAHGKDLSIIGIQLAQ
ncbi:MAG: hypothetical protein ABI797_06560 [Chloroflexota bacterium]